MTLEELRALRARRGETRILDLFAADPSRAQRFSVRAEGLVFDYSKTDIDVEARAGLLALAGAAGVAERREAMFTGQKINETEGRAVLHTALRDPDGAPVIVDGEDVKPFIRETLARMKAFAEGVRSGAIRAPGGAAFTDVVNIGIGGSDLGPAMAVRALAPYHDGPRCHFVSNIDPAHLTDTLAGLRPETTLVIVASKTFTTLETMENARAARDWMAAGVGQAAAGGHFVAISSAVEKARAFGIAPERVFGFGDYVGGRYSVWGPIGLSLMLAIGPERFGEFLAGGRAMDNHFRTAHGKANMPLMLGLVGIWHNQVSGHATRAVLPYEERLARLPAYLQQLEMESNGKRVTMDGRPLSEHSGPVVWGEPGTNGQHAFFQLIHQGTRVVPCEFMVGCEGHETELAHQHRLLQANCLAQSEALMRGRSLEEARAMLAGRYEGAELERQAAHRVFPGNRPSTTLVYPRLTPRVLGQIIALYEHRVFVEGVILGINSFDQWGVELGKELALSLAPVMAGEAEPEGRDGSTRMLVEVLRGR
jgi:glucose-6-phosphate isomerase